jgi:hypothetical protein
MEDPDPQNVFDHWQHVLTPPSKGGECGLPHFTIYPTDCKHFDPISTKEHNSHCVFLMWTVQAHMTRMPKTLQRPIHGPRGKTRLCARGIHSA